MSVWVAAQALAAGPEIASTGRLTGKKAPETALVNAPLRSNAEPSLEDFPYRITDNVRYADRDPTPPVNNAVYASYFETGRVTLMKDRSRGLMPAGLSWMMVRLDLNFSAELGWAG